MCIIQKYFNWASPNTETPSHLIFFIQLFWFVISLEFHFMKPNWAKNMCEVIGFSFRLFGLDVYLISSICYLVWTKCYNEKIGINLNICTQKKTKCPSWTCKNNLNCPFLMKSRVFLLNYKSPIVKHIH